MLSANALVAFSYSSFKFCILIICLRKWPFHKINAIFGVRRNFIQIFVTMGQIWMDNKEITYVDTKILGKINSKSLVELDKWLNEEEAVS